MKNQRKAFLCFAVLGLFLFCITAAASDQIAEQIAETARAATVYLEMTNRNGQHLVIGSGFFVGGNQIATNFHVIAEAASGTAKLVEKPTPYTIEGIIATDEENDLAILEVRMSGIQPLPLGDSDTVKIGQTVYAVGNPKGRKGTFSPGAISNLSKKNGKKRLQMTAPISPGSSGGPVLNRKGEVIGVSFATIEDGQNLNFAIPSNYLKELLARSGPAKPFPQSEQSISAETYLNLGNTMIHASELKKAIVMYDKAIQLKPDFAIAYYNRGFAKSLLGQYADAIADYDTAIQLDPTNAYVYYGFRGRVKADMGQHADAIADYDTAIQLDSANVHAYYNRGIAKSLLGQYADAIADYDTAIQLDPANAYVYSLRGLAKADMGQHEAAIADFDAAIDLDSELALAYVERGYAKSNLGQDEAAITDFDAAIDLIPKDFTAYVGRGISKSSLGQHEAAITDFDAAIDLDSDLALAYYSRGYAKHILGQYVAAIADYDKAIHLEPNYANAYHGRGLAKYNIGRNSEAKHDIQTALKLAEQAGNESLKADIEELLQKFD